MPLIARALLAFALLVLAPAAQAACSLASAVTADLGSRTSYDVRGGSVSSVLAGTSLNCSGEALLSLVTTDYATATVTSANGFVLRAAGGDTIAYRLSADHAGSYAFSQGGSINYLDPTLVGLLGVLGSNGLVPTIYAGLTSAPNVAAGTYTDTVTVRWSWQICHGIGAGGLCVLPERNTGTTVLTVTVVVTKDCRITAPAVSFGSAPLARQFTTVTQAVAVDCTKGATFSVAFTSGASGASRPWRQMKDGAGHVLRYNLYRADGTTIWDTENPLASASAGTGATTPTILQPYVARIDPGQATPVAGSYADTVSVVVTF